MRIFLKTGLLLVGTIVSASGARAESVVVASASSSSFGYVPTGCAVATMSSFAFSYVPSGQVVASASSEPFAYSPKRQTVSLGDETQADIESDGTCVISGTGDLRLTDATSSLMSRWKDITRLVVGDGITSIGAKVFANLKRVQEIEIGAGVTNVAADAFFACLNVTNIYIGVDVQSIAASAFARCNSLTTLRFASKELAEACQGKAFQIVTRITMKDSKPVIDAVPTVIVDGYVRVLKGCTTLGDAWETIPDPNNISSVYHFFKYEYEAQ